MTIKEFKYEMKLTNSGDSWGNAMNAFFEVAAHLYDKGVTIPDEWEYSPSMASEQAEEDSYWFELFSIETEENLIKFGNLLHRYTEFLKFKGVDY